MLSSLLMSEDDTSADALERAKSYFLVSAVVSNTLTFGSRPSMMKGYEEGVPDHVYGNGKNASPSQADRIRDPERGERVQSQGEEDSHQQSDNTAEEESNAGTDEDSEEEENRHRSHQTSLLPDPIDQEGGNLGNRVRERSRQCFDKLPRPLRLIIPSVCKFLNPPFFGAVIGVVLGLTPFLHRLFFNSTGQGGYFSAWLTSSIRNIGELFVALQMVVVGAKLSVSLQKLKRGESSGPLPWRLIVLVTIVRFILWPL